MRIQYGVLLDGCVLGATNKDSKDSTPPCFDPYMNVNVNHGSLFARADILVQDALLVMDLLHANWIHFESRRMFRETRSGLRDNNMNTGTPMLGIQKLLSGPMYFHKAIKTIFKRDFPCKVS